APEVYNATEWRAACPQLGKSTSLSANISNSFLNQLETLVMSEDCLFLSVYQPATASHSKWPVMVWIHGGGYLVGTIFSSIYDARQLVARGDLIVVTINYRLGPFGFL